MGQKCCKECCGGGSDDDTDSASSGRYMSLNGEPHGSHSGSSMPGRNGTSTSLATASSTSDLHRQSGSCVACGSLHGCHCTGPASARHPPSARMRTSASRESVDHYHSDTGTAKPSARGGGDRGAHAAKKHKKKSSFWSAFGRPSRRAEKDRPPPKRASGYDMLDRTQVVCLLGAGAFGSVSLVFHRPPPSSAQQHHHHLPAGQSPHPALAMSPAALNESSHLDGNVSGRVTPPAATPPAAAAGYGSPMQLDVTANRGDATPGTTTPQASRTPQFGRASDHQAQYIQALAAAPVGLPPRRSQLMSADDVASLGGSSHAGSFAGPSGGAGGSFAHTFATNTSQCFTTRNSQQRRVRFSVLKRISKRLKATIQGAAVDIAAERFRSAGLRHPFVMRLVEASQTESDYFNVFPFCLGADVGRMLSRRLSEVVVDASTTCAGDNVAALTRAIRDRAMEGSAAPNRCPCQASSPAGHTSPTSQDPLSPSNAPSMSGLPASPHALPTDRMCPVFNWSATEGGLSLPAVSLMAFEVLSALQFLATHTNRITHGDLKPENIFVSDTGHLMLGDFSLMTVGVLEPEPASTTAPKKRQSGLNKSFAGLFSSDSGGGPGGRGSPSSHQSPHSQSQSQSPLDRAEVERNPRYMPPEVVMGQWSPMPLPKDNGKEPVLDIWSYGVMLLEAATGVHPFFPIGTPIQHVGAMTKLTRGAYEPVPYPAQPTTPQLPSSATDADREHANSVAEQVYDGVVEAIDLLNDLIRRCIKPDPAKRITPSEAQMHPFFRHPIVLTHLGVSPASVAYEAARHLAHISHFATMPEAEAAFFLPETEQVNWPAIDVDQALSSAFSGVVWDTVVLHEGLQPPVVPRDVCTHGGLWIPDDVDLALTGKELFSSFCNTANVAPSANVSFSHQALLSGQASYAGFSMVVQSPNANKVRRRQSNVTAAAASGDGDGSSGAVTPQPSRSPQPPNLRVSFDADDDPMPQAAARSHLLAPGGGGSGGVSANHSRTASGNMPGLSGSSSGGGGVGGDAVHDVTAGKPAESFGDARIPIFCPVDLRFFATTQEEYDHWDDAKNKKWLGRTDADIREEAAEQQQTMAEHQQHHQQQQGGGGRGRGGGGNAFGGRGGHNGFSPEFLANYTYRGFDSAIFR